MRRKDAKFGVKIVNLIGKQNPFKPGTPWTISQYRRAHRRRIRRERHSK